MSRHRKRIVRTERQRRKRHYKREYRRRIERGLARGLTRSQARGHGGAGGASKAGKPLVIDRKNPRERALGKMKEGMSLKRAAKSERISATSSRRKKTFLGM